MSAKIIGNLNYESPIEQRLGDVLLPAVWETIECTTQLEVVTGRRKRRVDFHFKTPSRRIVVESDGRDFHDFDLDRERDTDLILHGGIDLILRLRGCDIHCADQECVSFILAAAPDLAMPDHEPLDREALQFLQDTIYTLKVRPIARARMGPRIIELKARDFDGRFHGRANMATRVVSQHEAKEIRKIVASVK